MCFRTKSASDPSRRFVVTVTVKFVEMTCVYGFSVTTIAFVFVWMLRTSVSYHVVAALRQNSCALCIIGVKSRKFC